LIAITLKTGYDVFVEMHFGWSIDKNGNFHLFPPLFGLFRVYVTRA
jgi:hypothetical protein